MIITMTKIDTAAAVAAVAFVWYCFHYVFVLWRMHFSGRRLLRCNEKSPSNLQPPSVRRFAATQVKALGKSRFYPSFQDCELLGKLKDLKVTEKDNEVIRERGRRLSYIDFMSHITSKSERACELNMDHIYIGFVDFLWGYLFIGIGSYLLSVKGVMWLLIRQFLISRGMLKMKDCDIEFVVGSLCLEQSQVVHYCTSSEKADGNNIEHVAVFLFVDFPFVDNNCDFQVADLFAVYIDLDTKKFIKANMDDCNLTASETLILLWFNTIGAQHVKLHSLANWGVNSGNNSTDSFLKRNSLVTIMYNFFGYTSFSNFFKVWEKQGLLSCSGWHDKQPMMKCFNHGIRENIGQHSHITELVKHSELVHFIINIRAIFFSEFSKYKHLFPGIDGEALFVGTILHSLDHSLMEWNLADPLWLDVNDSRFGKMAELGRLVRAGFVEDVPLLYFHKRFKNSGHPFYDAVYEKAAKINKKFADNMDTCIIK